MFLDMHTSFRSVELNLNYSLGEIRGQLSPLAVETPEPATTGLFAAGLLLLGAKAIWQRRKPGRS